MDTVATFSRVLLDVHHISSWAFLATVPKVYWIPQEAWIGWAPQSQVESVVLRSVGMWCLQCWQQRIIPGGSLRQDAVSLTRVKITTDNLKRIWCSFRFRVSGLFVHGPSGYLWKTKRERFQIAFIFWKSFPFQVACLNCGLKPPKEAGAQQRETCKLIVATSCYCFIKTWLKFKCLC